MSESPGEDQPGSSSPAPGSSSSGPSGQPVNSGKPSTSGQSAGSQPGSSGHPRSGSQPQKPQQPRRDDPPRSNGQSGSRGESGTRSQSGRNSDPVVDFQRWLMKAGARSMANQVADQVKRTIGQDKRRASGDVWDTATNEMPPNEPPECQWCPVCQAARAARMSGPGLGERLAGAGGVLASVVSDAFSAFEQAMKTQDQNRPSERAGAPPPRPAAPDHGETGQ